MSIEYCEGGCGYDVDECECNCADCGCYECECGSYCDDCGDDPCCCDPERDACTSKVHALLAPIYGANIGNWWSHDDGIHYKLLDEERYAELIALAEAEVALEQEWE